MSRLSTGTSIGSPFSAGVAACLDAEDGAGELLGLRLHRDARAAQLIEQLRQARVLGDVDLKAPQRLGDRILRRIGDRADLPAVLILEHERLEDVVDLLVLKRSSVDAVAVDGAGVLEVPDAGREEHDLGTGTSAFADAAAGCAAAERPAAATPPATIRSERVFTMCLA